MIIKIFNLDGTIAIQKEIEIKKDIRNDIQSCLRQAYYELGLNMPDYEVTRKW